MLWRVGLLPDHFRRRAAGRPLQWIPTFAGMSGEGSAATFFAMKDPTNAPLD